MAVAGKIACVTADESGLQVIDVSNPADPRIVGNVSTPGPTRLVAMADGFAYVSAGVSGLLIVDLADPNAPHVAGQITLAGPADGVAAAGGIVYVATGLGGLQVVDAGNPSAPYVLGSAASPYATRDVAVDGATAYVSCLQGGLLVFDVSDPTSPRLLGGVDTPGEASGIAVGSSSVLVADDDFGLQILPVQCSWRETATAPIGAGDPGSRLQIYPNPARERATVSFRLSPHSPSSPLAVDGSILLFDAGGRLIRRLPSRSPGPGTFQAEWDGRDEGGRTAAAGVYHARLHGAEGSTSARVVLIR